MAFPLHAENSMRNECQFPIKEKKEKKTSFIAY